MDYTYSCRTEAVRRVIMDKYGMDVYGEKAEEPAIVDN